VPPHGTSVVVVIEHGERLVGLLVNAVSDIITATDEMYQVAPDRQAAYHCKKPL
jgi:chemotaxis signal transduction protein